MALILVAAAGGLAVADGLCADTQPSAAEVAQSPGDRGRSPRQAIKWQRAPWPQAAQAAEEGAGTAAGAVAFVDATFGRGDLEGVGGLTVVKRAPAPTRTKSSINKTSNGGARD